MPKSWEDDGLDRTASEPPEVEPDPLAAARCYLDSGISLVPIARDESKRPSWADLPRVENKDGSSSPVWDVYQKRLPTPEEIARWYDRPEPCGIATVSGKISGNLELIDFDRHAEVIFPQWCALVEAACPGLTYRLNIVQTPRRPAGFHVRFRCREVEIPGNHPLAREPYVNDQGKPVWHILIETRGEGGYALAPGCPSACHETHRLYVHHSGPRLSQLRDITAAEREVLLRCARTFDRETPAAEPPPDVVGEELRPGDDFNRRGPDWSEILTGWTEVGQAGDKRLWRRPGKERGHSATTGFCASKDGLDLFYNFSGNAAPFESSKAYTKFSCYTLLHHDGDFKAAARTLAAQGYGKRTDQKASAKQGTDTPEAGKPERLLATTCLADLRMKPVEYLVEDVLPLGMATLVAGDGGMGKSTLVLTIAANLTAGTCCLGLTYAPSLPCEVLLIACEDGYEESVVPKLVVAGADLRKIHRVDGVRDKEGKILPFSVAYCDALEAELRRRPDVRMVVIDPASVYMGRAKVDDHRDSELRAALIPLAEMAVACKIALVLVMNLNKCMTTKALYRVSGGQGYVSTVRSSFAVVPADPDDEDGPDCKLMLPFNCPLREGLNG
jgi:hypothetical protein